MYCVCITKRFEGAISGVSVVTYIVCLYNSKFYANDNWLKCCYICRVCIYNKRFKRVISGLDFV